MLYSTVVADHVTTAGFLQGLQGKFVESTGNGTWRATTWTYASGSSSRTMTSSTAFATSLSAWTQVVAHVFSVAPHSRVLLRGHLSLPRDEPNGCADGSTRAQEHYRGTADQAQNGRRPGCELHGFNRQGQNTKNAAKFHTSVMCDGSHRPRRQRRRIQASNAGVEGTKRGNQYIIGHLARNSVATQEGILDPNGRCCF